MYWREAQRAAALLRCAETKGHISKHASVIESRTYSGNLVAFHHPVSTLIQALPTPPQLRVQEHSACCLRLRWAGVVVFQSRVSDVVLRPQSKSCDIGASDEAVCA